MKMHPSAQIAWIIALGVVLMMTVGCYIYLSAKAEHSNQNVIIIGNNGRYATEPRQVCADLERKTPHRIVLSVKYPGSCKQEETK